MKARIPFCFGRDFKMMIFMVGERARGGVLEIHLGSN
jgi:hypothetical protein